LEAIVIAQWVQWFQITECDTTLSVCILAGSKTIPSGIREYFPQKLKYQDFSIISSKLKGLYCISESAIDVLKIDLRFMIGDRFPQQAVVLLVLESDAACTILSGHSAKKNCNVGFSMMLQSHR